METKVTLHLAEDRLKIDGDYTVNVSKRGRVVDVNLTNPAGDFAFDAIHDKILGSVGEDGHVDVEVSAGSASRKYTGTKASYQFNAYGELLCFRTDEEKLAAGILDS